MELLRRSILAVAFALGVAAPPSVVVCAQAAPRQTVPAKLTDQEFWKFITDMSEDEGQFSSENLLSNETRYQDVIPGLLKSRRQGKVYLGVGPEQNFTYIAAIKPSIAIIFDIRRGNLLGHMLYKALFELSADRAEFVSRLFSKPRPPGLDSTSSASAIMDAYYTIFGDSATYQKNRRAVADLLMKSHGFALSASDTTRMFSIYDQFYYTGLDLTYTSTRGGGGGRGGFRGPGRMPSYYDIITADDGTGINRGFLGTEANWRVIRDMHTKNLIVPVVGDFGGAKAIKAVGKWLKDRGATVTAFYASNVEQYLWQPRDNPSKAYAYYDNVAQLPIDSTSVFIKSQGRGAGSPTFSGPGGLPLANKLCSIQDLLAANKAGRIISYDDIFSYCQ